MKSTHATEPTAGLHEFVSHLDRHRQSLAAEVRGHHVRKAEELLEQGYDVRTLDLMPDYHAFMRLGMAYWKLTAA